MHRNFEALYLAMSTSIIPTCLPLCMLQRGVTMMIVVGSISHQAFILTEVDECSLCGLRWCEADKRHFRGLESHSFLSATYRCYH